MYTMPHVQMWAPTDPPIVRVYEESYTPPVSPYKKVVQPSYQHNYIGIGTLYKPPGLGINILKFHPVPQTPEKVTEQLVIRK